MIVSPSLSLYVLKAATRDKLVVSICIVFLLAASVASFLASSAIIEQDQFASVLVSSIVRIVGVLGLILFCVFFIRRSYESKDIEFLLSRPISRTQLVFSYGFAFSLIAFVIGVLASVVLYAYSVSLPSLSGFLMWSFSLILEYIVIVNVAFFFSMVITSSSMAAMVVFAFYVFARMLGQLLGILDAAKLDAGKANEIMAFTIQVISALMPRLDLMAQSSWLLYDYNLSFDFMYLCLQALVFTILILLAALIDLLTKQF